MLKYKINIGDSNEEDIFTIYDSNHKNNLDYKIFGISHTSELMLLYESNKCNNCLFILYYGFEITNENKYSALLDVL